MSFILESNDCLNFGNILLLKEAEFISYIDLFNFFHGKNIHLNNNVTSIHDFICKMSMLEGYEFNYIINDTCVKILISLLNHINDIDDLDFYNYLCDINSKLKTLDFVCNANFDKILNRKLFVDSIEFFIKENQQNDISKYDFIESIEGKFALVTKGFFKGDFLSLNSNNNVCNIDIWNDYILQNVNYSYKFGSILDLKKFIIDNNIIINKAFDFDYLYEDSHITAYYNDFKDYLKKIAEDREIESGTSASGDPMIRTKDKNGQNVILREDSSDGRITLEVQDKGTSERIKVRYND